MALSERSLLDQRKSGRCDQLHLTAMGKDERALSVSGYVYRGEVKYTDYAFNTVSTHKRRSKNQLVDQIDSFRIGDKDSKRKDDLLDTFCYGISLSLGDDKGF